MTSQPPPYHPGEPCPHCGGAQLIRERVLPQLGVRQADEWSCLACGWAGSESAPLPYQRERRTGGSLR